MLRSNIFEAGTAEIPQLFGDYLDEPQSQLHPIVLAFSASPLGDQARNAIEKSCAALGLGDSACAYATLLPRNPHAEGGDIALDAQALFTLVEGTDPLRIIAADAQAGATLAQAYRTAVQPDCAFRAFGRPSVAFENLDDLLQTDEGKQRAWALFKTLAPTG